jgi:hypothetical protein
VPEFAEQVAARGEVVVNEAVDDLGLGDGAGYIAARCGPAIFAIDPSVADLQREVACTVEAGINGSTAGSAVDVRDGSCMKSAMLLLFASLAADGQILRPLGGVIVSSNELAKHSLATSWDQTAHF